MLKKIYDTHDNVRDVIAGVMTFRLVDLSRYRKGDTFTVNGFYEDEGYKIEVTYLGEEIIKTALGNMRCYKVKPSIPKNDVFDGKDAISIWLSADSAQVIMRIKARLFIGSMTIELQDWYPYVNELSTPYLFIAFSVVFRSVFIFCKCTKA